MTQKTEIHRSTSILSNRVVSNMNKMYNEAIIDDLKVIDSLFWIAKFYTSVIWIQKI